MAKDELKYEDFLNEVNPAYREFVNETHDFLLGNGCVLKMELAKSGYVVSYSHKASKRVIVNFVFRKSGLIIRIYGDNVNKYVNLIEGLPDAMIRSIEKAPVCKRLIDPLKCNSRCPMGYEFAVKGDEYKKCRYNCFMFEVDDQSIPFIKEFVENELRERAA